MIMVAEDTPEIAQLVKIILQARGHQVVTVADGLQMVEKAKDWKPHLIIADIMMPGTYGTAAYKALQADPVTAVIPVAFLTAVPLEQARKLVSEGPMVRLLMKPVEIPVLMKAVEELLPPKG